MRQYTETDEDDKREAEKLGAPEWMLEEVKRNPSYVHWGPHEDYMWKRDGRGWDSPAIADTWTECGFSLDELNEVVNFYFSIERDSEECPTCNGKSYHPDAQWISESFYRHSSPFTTPDLGEIGAKKTLERFGCEFTPSAVGRGTMPPDDVLKRYGKPFLDFCVRTMENDGHWDDDITQDEADALEAAHRGKKTVAKWNMGEGIGHDAINRWVLIEQRCKRLGVPVHCTECNGDGYRYTSPDCRLVLTLWVLHPRKGCSRGVEVKNIEQGELPAVYEYLSEAARRNAERFSRIPAVAVAV